MQKQDIAEINEIEKLTQIMAKAINPKKIYLFGSFARGEQKESSDYDFYIMVSDGNALKSTAIAALAYQSTFGKASRPLDIVVGKNANYEARKHLPLSLENIVSNEGVVLYE